MRVLVCGGRIYDDRERVFAVLDALPKVHSIIQGGATGADALAKAWAKERNVWCHEFPADWKNHGRSAGPIRNKLMLTVGRPHLVIAFPGNTGTQDMVRQSRLAGVEVRVIR